MKYFSFIAVLLLLVGVVFIGDTFQTKHPLTQASGNPQAGDACTTNAQNSTNFQNNPQSGTYQNIQACFDIPNRLYFYCAQWVQNGSNPITRGCKSGYDSQLCQTDKDLSHQACSPKVYNVCNTSMSASQCGSAGKNGYLCSWGQLQCVPNGQQTTSGHQEGEACTINNQAGTYKRVMGGCEVAAGSQVNPTVSSSCLGYDQRVCGMYYFCSWNSTKVNYTCQPNPITTSTTDNSCVTSTGKAGHTTTTEAGSKCYSNGKKGAYSCARSSGTYGNTGGQIKGCAQDNQYCQSDYYNPPYCFPTGANPSYQGCNNLSQTNCSYDYGCIWEDRHETITTCVENTTTTTNPEPDRTPPTLVSFEPTSGATNVSTKTKLTLTFSENVVTSSGNITIKKVSDNSVVQTIPANSPSIVTPDRPIVTFSGKVVTITLNPSLPYNTELYVTINGGPIYYQAAFVDYSSNTYAGINNTTTWRFTTAPDTEPPTLLPSSTPSNNAPNVAINSPLVLNFSKRIAKGNGDITVTKNDNSVVQTINLTSFTVTGSTATANLANLPYNTPLKINIPSGAFKDLANPANIFAGATINFTTAVDRSPITITSLNPANNSIGNSVVRQITITFNRPVSTVAGGKIVMTKDTTYDWSYISRNSSSFVLAQIPVSVSTTASTTYSFSVNIPAGTRVRFIITPNTFKDLASGISFSGILNSWPNTWIFTNGVCLNETQSACTSGANLYRGCVWLSNSCQKPTQCNQLTQYSCEGDNNLVVTNTTLSPRITQCYLDNSKNPRSCSLTRPTTCESRTPNPIICDGDNKCDLITDVSNPGNNQCKSKPAPACGATNQTACEADPAGCKWNSSGFVGSCSKKSLSVPPPSSVPPPPPPACSGNGC